MSSGPECNVSEWHLTAILGFGHEHTRADRDNNIRINFGNIQSGVEGNYKIIPHQYWDSLGTRYEMRSVMHYGSYAGSFSRSLSDWLFRRPTCI